MTVSRCTLDLNVSSRAFKGRVWTGSFTQQRSCSKLSRTMTQGRAYRVEIERADAVETITVEEGGTILQAALDQGIELPHDCKMGVCMTCPARLVRHSKASMALYLGSAGALDAAPPDARMTLWRM